MTLIVKNIDLNFFMHKFNRILFAINKFVEAKYFRRIYCQNVSINSFDYATAATTTFGSIFLCNFISMVRIFSLHTHTHCHRHTTHNKFQFYLKQYFCLNGFKISTHTYTQAQTMCVFALVCHSIYVLRK